MRAFGLWSADCSLSRSDLLSIGVLHPDNTQQPERCPTLSTWYCRGHRLSRDQERQDDSECANSSVNPPSSPDQRGSSAVAVFASFARGEPSDYQTEQCCGTGAKTQDDSALRARPIFSLARAITSSTRRSASGCASPVRVVTKRTSSVRSSGSTPRWLEEVSRMRPASARVGSMLTSGRTPRNRRSMS